MNAQSIQLLLQAMKAVIFLVGLLALTVSARELC
jgi:hypothetical protein